MGLGKKGILTASIPICWHFRAQKIGPEGILRADVDAIS